jgi:hypothetical protein
MPLVAAAVAELLPAIKARGRREGKPGQVLAF